MKPTRHSIRRPMGRRHLFGVVLGLATVALTAFALVTRAASHEQTACFGLTDREVLDSIQRAYADRGQRTTEMAERSRTDRARIIGVERFGERGEGAFVGMLFRQDNGTIFTVRLSEDCTYQAGAAEDSTLGSRAYQLNPPAL